jgi:hypothetical protein
MYPVFENAAKFAKSFGYTLAISDCILIWDFFIAHNARSRRVFGRKKSLAVAQRRGEKYW